MEKGNIIVYDGCVFKVTNVTPNGLFIDLECLYTCSVNHTLYTVGDKVKGFSFKNKKYKKLDLS